eukprot:scaffold3426_cov355-Prasinococcus_capsulatus_cf.AAC.13
MAQHAQGMSELVISALIARRYFCMFLPASAGLQTHRQVGGRHQHQPAGRHRRRQLWPNLGSDPGQIPSRDDIP